MISIIIPIYNAGGVVSNCIKSILEQSYTDYEVILVDDGSTDNSGEVCQSIVKKDNRFIYVRQENKGVSSARNRGIGLANGEFIVFVDGDDCLDRNYLNCLISEVGDNDLAVCGYKKILDTDIYNSKQIDMHKIQFIKYSANKYCEELFSVGNLEYQGYVWGKLYRADVIKKNDIYFDENIAYNEDRLFLVQYLDNCKRSVVYCPEELYIYIQSDNSAMGKLKKSYNSKMISELAAYKKIEMCLKAKNKIAYKGVILDGYFATLVIGKQIPNSEKKVLMDYRKYFFNLIMKNKDISFKKKVKTVLDYIMG